MAEVSGVVDCAHQPKVVGCSGEEQFGIAGAKWGCAGFEPATGVDAHLLTKGPSGTSEDASRQEWSDASTGINSGDHSPEPTAPSSAAESSESASTASTTSSGCDEGQQQHPEASRVREEDGCGHAEQRNQRQEPAKTSQNGRKPGMGGGGGDSGGGGGGQQQQQQQHGRGGGGGGGSNRGGGGGRQPRGNRGSGGGGGGDEGDRGGKQGGQGQRGGGGGGKGGGAKQGGSNKGRGPRGPGNHVTRPTQEQLALNRSLSGLDNPVAVLELLQGASEKGIVINATNLATGIHRIASRGGGNKPKLLRNPWLGALLNLIFRRLQEDGAEFSSRELATVAWAVGKLGFKVDLVFCELRAECSRRGFSTFNWHDMSNLTWAHAVTPGRGKDWEECMMMLAREAESRPLVGVTPQALANLAWALSTLGLSHGGNSAQVLLERMAEHAVQLGMGSFKPQEVSAMLWAMAVGGVKAPALFGMVADNLVKDMMDGYNAQKMATLACAFAQTGNVAPELFDMMEEALVERAMSGFNPANTATIAWAFASARHHTEDVLSVCEERVWQLGMNGFSDVHIVLLVWALASSSYRGPADSMARDTLNMIEVELRKRKLKDMPEAHLATLIWAFGRLGHPGGGGIVRVQKELLSRGWVQPEGEEDGSFSWSLASRSRSSRDKTPKLIRKGGVNTSPGGLMRVGYGAMANVTVGGGCWAVEGAEEAVRPRQKGDSSSSSASAATASPLGAVIEDGEWTAPVSAPASQPATWARPVPK